MKLHKYLIVDNSESDVISLQNQMSKFPLLRLSKVCSSIEEAIETVASECIDLIFLEARFSNEKVFSLLKNRFLLPPIIMMSSHPEDACASYEVGVASDFLLKPFTFTRLMLSLNRSLQLHSNLNSFANSDSIFLKSGRKIQRFRYSSIEYIESYGIYSKIHMHDEVFTVNERISSLTRLLPPRFFMRIHKSFIVNVTRITGFDKAYIYTDSIKIAIGVSYRSSLENLMNLLEPKEQKAIAV